MYLSAQRVADELGRGGVSVSVYTHDGSLDSVSASQEEFVTHVATFPGRLVLHAPSPSHGAPAYVLSYLDVLAPDSASMCSILPQLDEAVDDAPVAIWSHSPLALRFYVHPSAKLDRGKELRRLKDELRLLAGAGAPELGNGRAPQPLRVMLTVDEVGKTYELDQDSRSYLDRVLPGPRPRRLCVPHQTQDALRAILRASDADAEYVRMLTRMSLTQVQALAGAVVVEAATGDTVWNSDDG